MRVPLAATMLDDRTAIGFSLFYTASCQMPFLGSCTQTLGLTLKVPPPFPEGAADSTAAILTVTCVWGISYLRFGGGGVKVRMGKVAVDVVAWVLVELPLQCKPLYCKRAPPAIFRAVAPAGRVV